jgi:hypothetical protein
MPETENNLFELFHAAVLRYLGVKSLTPRQRSTIESAFATLTAQYGGSARIDYSSEACRLAYTLHFAPKHAIAWREYMRFGNRGANGNLQLNSIGTGPGAEIIGIFEGASWKGGNTSRWRCYDAESGWGEILRAVIEEYRSRTGIGAMIEEVSSVDKLHKGKFVVGSFLLSELVKQPNHKSFRSIITKAVGPTSGIILDVTKCRLEDGNNEFISKMFGFNFDNLKGMGIQLKDIVNQEMNSCGNSCCRRPIVFEPSLNMFRPDFR